MLRQKNSLYSLALLALALLMLFAATSLAAKGPKAEFEKLEIDLKTVREGQILEAVFKFTNKGDMNLIISKVSPSCGCTASSYSKVTKPGMDGEVTLTLDTEGIHGEFRKTAVVSTNDSSKSFVTLVLVGQTKSRIHVDKGRRIKLNGCLGDGEIATTATISDPEGKPLLIMGLDNPMSDYLEATISHKVKKKSYVLTLRSLAKEAVEIAGPLFFNLAGGARVSLYVVMKVKGPVWVQPREMYLGGISKNGKAVKRYILLKKQCVDKLTLDTLTYDPQYIKVKPVWEKKEEKLFLEVTPNLTSLPMGALKQYIKVRASGTDYKISVKGTVRN
jgi:hypothetical protein